VAIRPCAGRCLACAARMGSQDVLDAKLLKALGHPLRMRLLTFVTEAGRGQPGGRCRAHSTSRWPRSATTRGFCVISDTSSSREPSRDAGALEHYYRATAAPFLDDEHWETAPGPGPAPGGCAALPSGLEGRCLGRSERRLRRSQRARGAGWSSISTPAAGATCPGPCSRSSSGRRRSRRAATRGRAAGRARARAVAPVGARDSPFRARGPRRLAGWPRAPSARPAPSVIGRRR